MIRRARPLLGTVVAISADGPPPAVDAAFAAIERVHCLMSAQCADSDIGRVNRDALHGPVAVDAWTFEVLAQAGEISERSRGAFDVVTPGTRARYTDVVLEHGAVRLRRPARIDVSGVAKGFAVDRAVDALRVNGAIAGSVNAGGDLRFFGNWAGPVRVRVPGHPGWAIALPPSAHTAFATSSGYFGTMLNDPRSGASLTLDCSVTVAAASCLVADALTKAVALLGPLRHLLATFGATAYAVERNGKLHASTG